MNLPWEKLKAMNEVSPLTPAEGERLWTDLVKYQERYPAAWPEKTNRSSPRLWWLAGTLVVGALVLVVGRSLVFGPGVARDDAMMEMMAVPEGMERASDDLMIMSAPESRIDLSNWREEALELQAIINREIEFVGSESTQYDTLVSWSNDIEAILATTTGSEATYQRIEELQDLFANYLETGEVGNSLE